MKELAALGGVLVVAAAILAAMGFRGRDQVVGIDLGTTFSVVALKSRDGVSVVPDFQSRKLLVPSVVTFFPNGSVVAGDRAVALRSRYPQHTIFNAKRFIGRTMSEVAADAAAHPFRVVGNTSDGGQADTVAAGFAIQQDIQPERWVSPIDVGAEVVKHLKQSILAHTGYPITRAVICVPAKFTERETAATQRAFQAAGIKVMRVLEEPTAAAVAYNLHKAQGARNVLVYDIGGGTLDTSLLYMSGRSVNMLGVAGDDHLGGSDFDHKMRQLLEAKLASSQGVQGASATGLQSCDRTGLHILAEQAKIELSSVSATEVRCVAEDGAVRVLPVTRAEFEHACDELFSRSMKPVEKVLADQMMTPADVDDVVLVGGASRTPRLRELLQALMGPDKRLHTDIDPDITVAYGAANILD